MMEGVLEVIEVEKVRPSATALVGAVSVIEQGVPLALDGGQILFTKIPFCN